MLQIPVTVRRSIELMGLCTLMVLLHVAGGIITPLLLALFLSLVLLPVFQYLKQKGFSENGAGILCMLVLFAIAVLTTWFFYAQLARLLSDYSTLQKNMQLHLTNASGWINQKTNFNNEKQLQILGEGGKEIASGAGALLQSAIGSFGVILLNLVLVPVYILLILLYRKVLVSFILLWFKENAYTNIKEGLGEIQSITKKYLLGLCLRVLYMTMLIGISLLIMGIKNAFLIAILFAFLNLIPYLGRIIGYLLTILITLGTSAVVWPVFASVIAITIIGFIDGNILMPLIVGSKVKINALATTVGVFIGAAIGGIAGMFLYLPVAAILKIIFDRSKGFRHWGMILGDGKIALSTSEQSSINSAL